MRLNGGCASGRSGFSSRLVLPQSCSGTVLVGRYPPPARRIRCDPRSRHRQELLLLCAPVKIDPLAMAPALPLSQLRIVKASAPAVGQDEVVAESGSSVKQSGEVALGTSEGL